MKEKVFRYIEENSMIAKGDRVLVALSGGPDSVCLLSILEELKEDLNIEILAAHLNHCIRGEEADNDEEYSRLLCEKLNIRFYSQRVKVEDMASELGISSEMAGRKARYDFFDDIKKKENINKIALAHNANDQAETILMRLMRGTGMDGLEGIKPIRDGKYIRPILCLTRPEIEKYCNLKKLDPKIDKTNLDPIYARNKVRLELIPYIQKNFNEDIINTLNRFSSITSRDNSYMDEMTEKAFEKYVLLSKERAVIGKECFKEHSAIVTRVIRKAIENIVNSLNNFQQIHILDIIDLQKTNGGKYINLPMNIVAENVYGDIILRLKNDDTIDYSPLKIALKNFEEKQLQKGIFMGKIFNYNIFIRLIMKNKSINIKGNDYTRYFEFPVDSDIVIRQREQGDKFVPYGMKGNKKLKDLFMDMKISKEKRDKTPIVLFDNVITWIVGYRTSNNFKIDKDTKQILEIKAEWEDTTYDE